MQASDVKKQIRKSGVLFLLMSATMLSVLGATQLLAAQQQGQPPAAAPEPPAAPSTPPARAEIEELLPLHNEEPVYPRVAADEGIEGWVQVKFTVAADGSVPENSISVVDAEPADVFNRSAMNAAAKFRFRPRMSGGEAVDVPNVQYVFRYKLENEEEDQGAR